MTWRVGVDSGGTFTDICLFDDQTGRLEVWKVASTPSDPSEGIALGVEQGVANVGSDAEAIGYLGHGTTVATNALIELKGAKTGLIVTDGFRDLLELGRQKRPSLYDMTVDKPPELVRRNLRLEVRERVRFDGSVEIELDEQGVRLAVEKLREADVGAVAVCFLYAFLNTKHEATALRILKEELPDVSVSVSHEVAPEFREFERLSTTVANAYLSPIMQRYIGRLERRLTDFGLKTAPHMTQSNGGVVSFEAAAKLPVRALLSGPSTGVVAAQAIGQAAGFDNLITFDVGGTSSDVALLTQGVCSVSGEADVHGYPIKAPMLDIHTVGAGGGSIATVDSGGLLKVGPRSAGADPGPACYGLGNTEPTVTDANIVLQTLNPVEILGGRMKVRRDLALASIEKLAEGLGLGTMEAAQGIISVLTANMAKAIRVISVQRGYDPRDYALMAFGGAGPLHAARLARELDIKTVIVPLAPGILCAMGLLLTDLRADFATTRLLTLEPSSLPAVREGYGALQSQAQTWFDIEGISPSRRRITRTVDMRYQGQNYELQVHLPDGPIDEASMAALAAGFADAHQQRYGFTADGDAVQIVTLRVEATGIVEKAKLRPAPAAGANADAARQGSRDVHMPGLGGFVSCPIYARDRLKPGNMFEGPAIVEQMDSTTVVLPGMTARVDAYLNIILEG